MSIERSRPQRRRSALTIPAIAAAILTSACAQTSLETGALSVAETGDAESQAQAASRAVASAAEIDARDRASMKPATASAIAEARKLRDDGRKTAALARLDAAAEKAGTDRALDKERGLLALDVGQVKKAVTLLRRAHDPKNPDWRVLSGLGAALSASGKQQEAQAQLTKALELAPEHPSILNNLALSYALDGKHDKAESLLRKASAHKGSSTLSRQNLALLVGLNGNVEEARRMSEGALPATAVRANVGYLERLKSGKQISRAEPEAPASIRAASASSE